MNWPAKAIFRSGGKSQMLLAALWGLAEATLFFIVPDIWLTLLAVRQGFRPALTACVFALAGALLGGIVMYVWGVFDAHSARAVLDHVPAVSPAMIAEIQTSLRADGVGAVLFGPLKGFPYKVYAVEAGAGGISPIAFLAISVPARLFRFVILVGIASAASHLLRQNVSIRVRIGILLVAWAAFYSWYFVFSPG